jgi:DNA-binding MarR family transcriptional regulator
MAGETIVAVYNVHAVKTQGEVGDSIRMVGTMLRFIRAVSSAFREQSGADLNLTDLSVLAQIERGSDLPSLVARRLQLDAPRVTRSTDRLVALGYVVRSEDPADRRRTRLEITASGREFLTTGRRAITAAVEGILSRVPDEDRAALSRVLGEIRAVLDDRSDSGPDRES